MQFWQKFTKIDIDSSSPDRNGNPFCLVSLTRQKDWEWIAGKPILKFTIGYAPKNKYLSNFTKWKHL
ncbi:hypothetical protein J2X31_001892 [Flavobacterium arsenatis]|uniref:Uncharacterized protein n=1 Tax=Flavobacterium arsenatis TaxID=1484332 RepID=A0ABU1TPT0_9FLAO|nr:hypothetical protein [Flavobacterium arsenatis]